MKSLIATLALSLTIANANAGFVERGTVVAIEPVYRNIVTDSPRTICNNVQVPVYEDRTYRSGSTHGDVGSTVGGAIIGGIIGHAIDPTGGSGVGAVIGGLVGNQHNRHSDVVRERTVTGYRTERECRTTYDEHYKSVLSHFSVTVKVGNRNVVLDSDYRYNIGDRIEFDVSLTPRR